MGSPIGGGCSLWITTVTMQGCTGSAWQQSFFSGLLCPSPLSLSLLPALLIDGRQLGHQHAAEHQTAADEAAQTQHLAENQPAGQCCKHGLKTENDRSMGSDGVLLGHHLQGEPYTHCENTAEGNRRGCQQYCREVC